MWFVRKALSPGLPKSSFELTVEPGGVNLVEFTNLSHDRFDDTSISLSVIATLLFGYGCMRYLWKCYLSAPHSLPITSRTFFWSKNVIWKEDILDHRCMVMLAEKDSIINSGKIWRYLRGGEVIPEKEKVLGEKEGEGDENAGERKKRAGR